LLYILLILPLRIFKRFHRAPDPLTILLDQVMLENDAAWLVFSVFPMMFDHHQLVFTFGPYLNLFRPITKLVRPFSFPLSITSSILSLLIKLWDPLVGPISSPVGNPDLRMSPSPMRHRVLILVRVGAQHDISRPI
jgi:hypothetical protein